MTTKCLLQNSSKLWKIGKPANISEKIAEYAAHKSMKKKVLEFMRRLFSNQKFVEVVCSVQPMLSVVFSMFFRCHAGNVP